MFQNSPRRSTILLSLLVMSRDVSDLCGYGYLGRVTCPYKGMTELCQKSCCSPVLLDHKDKKVFFTKYEYISCFLFVAFIDYMPIMYDNTESMVLVQSCVYKISNVGT